MAGPISSLGSKPRVFNATDVGSVEGPGSALGTFKTKGWGVAAPVSELTLRDDGSFSAKLPGGATAKGSFQLKDNAAAFPDTLTLQTSTGLTTTFAVGDITKTPDGSITSLTLTELGQNGGTGKPFTLSL